MRKGYDYSFGWFSTGRDKAACDLLRAAKEATDSGFVPAKIEYVFANREFGEAPESDSFLRLASELGIPQLTLSSRRFEPDLWKRDRLAWRHRFDQQIMERLADYKVDTVVLAGYMLIASPGLCRSYPMLNLHPALPGGPVGSWEQVVDALIEQHATETGIQVHRVTPDLDQGPALAFCRFLIPACPDKERLRKLIRNLQVTREIPLLILALRALALGDARIYKDTLVDINGNPVSPLDLTQEVERMLKRPES